MEFKAIQSQASKKNIIYIFVNELRSICGVYLDFACIQKTFLMNKNMTNIYNWYENGNRNTIRIENGSDIYQTTGDEIIWVDIKSEQFQISEYINNMK